MLIQWRSLCRKGLPWILGRLRRWGRSQARAAERAAMREIGEELGIEVTILGPAAMTLAFEGGYDDYFLTEV